KFVKPFLLFFLVYIEKKFNNQVAVLCQLFLKGIDRVESSRQLLVLRAFFKPVDQYSPIPASVKDRHSSSRRSLRPEPPHKRMHPFFLCLIFNRMHLISSLIHALDQAADLPSFSRCAKTFEYNQDRNPQRFAFPLTPSEPCFKLRHFLFILLL